jgi:hypothetical protein
MAYDLLQEKSPASLSKANDVLAVLHEADPDLTYKEGNYTFVECVTLADDIKYHGGGWQSSWHFVDTPYLDEGGSIDDYDFNF